MHKFAHKIIKDINSPLKEVDVQHIPGSALPVVGPCPHAVIYTTYALLMGGREAGGLRIVGRVRGCPRTSSSLGSLGLRLGLIFVYVYIEFDEVFSQKFFDHLIFVAVEEDFLACEAPVNH